MLTLIKNNMDSKVDLPNNLWKAKKENESNNNTNQNKTQSPTKIKPPQKQGLTLGKLKKDQGVKKGTGSLLLQTLEWLETNNNRNEEIYGGIMENTFEDKAFGSIVGSFIADAISTYLKKEIQLTMTSDDKMEKCFAMNGGGQYSLGPG